jgi:hypothetical protein
MKVHDVGDAARLGPQDVDSDNGCDVSSIFSRAPNVTPETTKTLHTLAADALASSDSSNETAEGAKLYMRSSMAGLWTKMTSVAVFRQSSERRTDTTPRVFDTSKLERIALPGQCLNRPKWIRT